MSRFRAHSISVSLDGFMAGPHQSVDDPLGIGAEALHEWMFAGLDAGSGIDFDHAQARTERAGATIMGRNMFGPVRGDWSTWTAGAWRGWWGEDPPYHHPVFVLTHHAHAPIEMEGGTTFHFVTDGIRSALDQARAAAGDDDVILGGGASTVRQYLAAGLLDDLHVAVAPVLLGSGERLFDGLASLPQGYEVGGVASSPAVAHFHLRRTGS